MHKDPPPGILERSPKVIVTYGLLTGFVIGIVVIGTWSLFTTGHTTPKQSPPVIEKVR